MRVKHLILAAVLFAGPGNSFAHEEANGPNGGQIADVQGHHVEFTQGQEIVLRIGPRRQVSVLILPLCA